MNQIIKLNQKLETEAKNMDEQLTKAIDIVKENFDRKRSELKDKLNKLKEEEHEVLNKFRQDDNQLQQEMSKIETQIDTVAVAERTAASAFPQIDPQQDFHRRSQLMIQIFADTHKEMEALIRDYKDKIKRFEVVLKKNLQNEKNLQSIGTGMNSDFNQLKTYIDQKTNSLRDVINKLDDIRHEIDRKNKELFELEKSETQELTEAEKKCSKEEETERKNETNRFSRKVTELFNKQLN